MCISSMAHTLDNIKIHVTRVKILKISNVFAFQVDEEIYHDQMTKIEQLLNQLTSIDVEKGNPGKITKNELMSGIQTVLPNVDEESMAALVKGAELELDAQNAEEIDYKEMFKEVNA